MCVDPLGRGGADVRGGATEGMKMNPRVKILKQLVTDGHYVVDEPAIAHAMVLRSMVQRALPDVTFRCAPRVVVQQVRSFRPHRGARSFRLSRAQRRRLHARSRAASPIS
jgi:hypothetical protein